ncbi:LOW QUALITY PROTEIN: hypothetical protein YC2023_017771 [Brassica napus]
MQETENVLNRICKKRKENEGNKNSAGLTLLQLFNFTHVGVYGYTPYTSWWIWFIAFT